VEKLLQRLGTVFDLVVLLNSGSDADVCGFLALRERESERVHGGFGALKDSIAGRSVHRVRDLDDGQIAHAAAGGL
jgi:hypothetical protein